MSEALWELQFGRTLELTLGNIQGIMNRKQHLNHKLEVLVEFISWKRFGDNQMEARLGN